MRNKDPFWITAKYNSTCACGQPIPKGTPAFYYPLSHKAVCLDCGHKGEADLNNEKSMERGY